MFTAVFLKATAERAIKTFAQTVLALAGTDAVKVLSVGIGDTLVAASAAAVLSVFTSIASANFGPGFGPSLANEELVEY